MKPLRYIFINQSSGRLANTLTNSAHYYAASYEHNYNYIDFALSSYLRYFDISQKDLIAADRSGLYYRFYSWARKLKLIRKIRNKTVGTVYADEEKEISSSVYKNNYIPDLVEFIGWGNRANNLVLKHQNLIRKLFKPTKAVAEMPESIVKQKRGNSRVVVGLHVRLRDYEKFRSGEFYLSIEDYRSIILSVRKRWRNERLSVIICTDDLSEASLLLDDCTVVSGGNEIEDLYCLSLCDFIIGPISSYSTFASFLGKKPLLRLKKENLNVSEAEFLEYLPGGFSARSFLP